MTWVALCLVARRAEAEAALAAEAAVAAEAARVWAMAHPAVHDHMTWVALCLVARTAEAEAAVAAEAARVWAVERRSQAEAAAPLQAAEAAAMAAQVLAENLFFEVSSDEGSVPMEERAEMCRQAWASVPMDAQRAWRYEDEFACNSESIRLQLELIRLQLESIRVMREGPQ
jgi:hypothetical protein